MLHTGLPTNIYFVTIVRDAQLVVTFNLGGGPTSVTSTKKLDDGEIHKIQIDIKQKLTSSVNQSESSEWKCTIQVDDIQETSATSKHV